MTAAEEELREAAPQPAKRAWIRRRTWRGEPYVGGKRDKIGQSFGAAHPGGHKDRKHGNYDAFCQGGDSGIPAATRGDGPGAPFLAVGEAVFQTLQPEKS